VITQVPQPTQVALLASNIEDLLFGGMRFGGETDGLLGDFTNRAQG